MSSQCTLIADETDDAVQLVLGIIALSSLYGKWHFETPRRPARIWFMDAMKQGTSAAMVHVVNIVFSIGIADFSAKPGDADEVRTSLCVCSSHSLCMRSRVHSLSVQCTGATAVRVLLYERSDRHDARRVHRVPLAPARDGACGTSCSSLCASAAVTGAPTHSCCCIPHVQIRRNWRSLKHPGRYGEPPSVRVWFLQLLSWSGVLLVMKLFVGLAIYIFSAPLGLIGSLLFFPVHHHPKIELLIVMIGCPLVMNMVQFWIQDSFLKDHTSITNASDSAESDCCDDEGRPLLPLRAPAHSSSSRLRDASPIKLHGGIPRPSKLHTPPVSSSSSSSQAKTSKSFTNAATAVDMYEDL